MIDCFYCLHSDDDAEQHLSHMKEKHSGTLRDKFQCPLCLIPITRYNYARHVSKMHPEAFKEKNAENDFDYNMEQQDDEPYYSDTNENHMEGLENLVEEEMEELTIDEQITAYTNSSEDPKIEMKKRVQILLCECDRNWMTLLKQPGVTKKLASEVYSQYKGIIMATLDLCTLFMEPENMEKIIETLEHGLKTRRSEYMRMKQLEKNMCYIPPTKFVHNYRFETAQTSTGMQAVQRSCNFARVGIRQTLETLFTNKNLCNAMVYQSDYTNCETYSHPFCGNRAKAIYNQVGSDFIALKIFMDEFNPVNPLGHAASTNKIMGCYFQIMNLPWHLQNVSNVFLGFLVVSSDLKNDFQGALEKLLVEELSDLENNGVTVFYKGAETQLPVILQILVGDNLGIHQMCAFVCSFSGISPCRSCMITSAELQQNEQCYGTTPKTKESYNRAINSGNKEVMRRNGITEKCALNRLRYFHVMDSLCADMMHDLFLGYLPRFMACVTNSILKEEGITLERLNNAITSFPYSGSARRNPPMKLFEEYLKEGMIKRNTAAMMFNFVTLLPLIMKTNGITVPNSNKWWLLYLLFLEILDILFMRDVSEEKLTEMDDLIKAFLCKYLQLGGHMTVKPHYLTHYSTFIRQHGPLIYYWCMQFEAKHQDFKRYAKVNFNHQDLAMTLANRHQLMVIRYFMEMQDHHCVANSYRKFVSGHLKCGNIVVYGYCSATNMPMLGKIIHFEDATHTLRLLRLRVTQMDMQAHAYVIENTTDFVVTTFDNLLLKESFPKYLNYVRKPCAFMP